MPLTRVIRVDPLHPDPGAIAEAGAALARGALVAFPTETVYGLGANALEAAAVRRIFDAKGRPNADPLIVHVTRLEQIDALVTRRPAVLERLEAFWPGPLTVVLPKSARVPPEVTAGLETVAVRVPAHPVARAILEAAGVPVAAPSANTFTRPSPTDALHVLQDLEGKIDLLIDGGPTQHGVESTVIDLTGAHPVLLRPGAVTVERLREVLPDLEAPEPVQADATAQALRSPGTHLKHYSPRARVLLFVGEAAAVQDAMAREAGRLMGEGQLVGLMKVGTGVLADLPVRVATLGEAGDLEAAARRLFAALRELDESGVDVILVAGFPPEGLGRTLQDRLLRAAEGQVIRV